MGTKADRNVETRKPDGQAAGGTDLPSSASSSSTGSDTELGNGAPLAIGRTRRCWKCGCQSRRLPRYFAARRRPTKPSAHTKCKPPHKMEDGISCQPPICTTSHASAHVSDGHSSAVAGAQKGLGWCWSADRQLVVRWWSAVARTPECLRFALREPGGQCGSGDCNRAHRPMSPPRSSPASGWRRRCQSDRWMS